MQPAAPGDGVEGVFVEPFVDERVAVGEAEDAAVVVVAGGQIVPGVGVGHVGDEPAVVEAIGVLVGKREHVGGRWAANVALRRVLSPGRWLQRADGRAGIFTLAELGAQRPRRAALLCSLTARPGGSGGRSAAA